MPSILLVPDDTDADQTSEFHFKERVAASLLSDPHFAAQLIERLAWAIRDAEQADPACASGPLQLPRMPDGHDNQTCPIRCGRTAESRDRETAGRIGPDGRSVYRRLWPRHTSSRNLPARRDARGPGDPASGI